MNTIGICICTFRRPGLLKELLTACSRLRLPPGWECAAFVVDNDSQRSAEPVACTMAAQGRIPIEYDTEPIQNIALSRNRAIENALARGCTLLALIDDDELPDRNWLLELYEALTGHSCSGVLGPVLPRFESPPPHWVIRSGFLRRTFDFPGSPLSWAKTRTGNVLFQASILAGEVRPFDPEFGESGGEDIDFFKRMMEKGHCFVGVNSGAVHEFIPSNRARLSHLIRRAYIQGGTNIALERKYGASWSSQCRMIGKSLAASLIYGGLLPFLLLVRAPGMARIGAGLFFHLGRLRRFFNSAGTLRRSEFR
jgi:glycosyltransferase involved in cell wall biosynthesis